MSDLKVSVITPSFNCAKYIQGTIESLLAQDYPDIEHIVVDGGSTDETIDILKSYDHIKWISEPDHGMYDAINKGIHLSSGTIIAYLNADDRYFNHTLSTVVNSFNLSTDIDFVYGYCQFVNEYGRPLYLLRPLNYELIKNNLRIVPPQPTLFWRSSIHSTIGYFDPIFRYTGDVDFLSRIFRNGLKGKLIRKPLAQFMLREDCLSLTGEHRLKNENKLIRLLYQRDQKANVKVKTEALMALQNIYSYIFRLRYRWLGRGTY